MEIAAFSESLRLSDRLRLHMKKSAFDKTPYKFLPQDILDSIITETTVRHAMAFTKSTPDARELIAYILVDAKRLFATAVYIGLEPDTLYETMVLFRNTKFSDERLPLEVMRKEHLTRYVIGEQLHPLLELEGRDQDDAKRIWTPLRCYNFSEAQFKFLAPIIHLGKRDHDFGNLILPFVKKHAAQNEGSFGMVSQYKIHSHHFDIPSKQKIIPSNSWAVKEFKLIHGSNPKEVTRRWASEVNTLATVNTLNQDHVVRFIAAFSRGTPEEPEHYLVTEWADGGNLRDLWRSMPNPPLQPPFTRKAVGNLRGLVEALSAIHDPMSAIHDPIIDGAPTKTYGRHGDLKPENILRFCDGDAFGTLKICDFGEAKRHKAVTAMRNRNTTARYGTRRYEPPESEIGIGTDHLGRRDMRISRRYDIWSIGCIMLEMIIWLLYGAKGLGEFNESVKTGFGDESPFYQVFHTGGKISAKVHEVVVLWMKHISKDPACRAGTTALGDLLELVERGLLVVKLPSHDGLIERNDSRLYHNMPWDGHFHDGLSNHYWAPESTPFEAKHTALHIAVRYNAHEALKTLLNIESRQADDSYWSTQRVSPLPVLHLHKTSLGYLTGNVGDEGDTEVHFVHFTARGRPRGSKNKQTTRKTSNSMEISSLTPSSSRPLKRKLQDDDDDDQGDQNDKQQFLQWKNGKNCSTPCDLACPFAKYQPLEYPQCRQSRYRDIAKIKEHLRNHHRMSCSRCGEAFHTENALKEHSRRSKMCKVESEPDLAKLFTYMRRGQEAQIMVHGMSWPEMYEILFPDHPFPGVSFDEDPEMLAFDMIAKTHNSAHSLQHFELYRQNMRAESTCAARAVLQCNCTTTTTTTRSEAFSTSDSGYSAPEEGYSAVGPSASSAEHPDPAPQVQESITLVHASNTLPEYKADLGGDSLPQSVFEVADVAGNMEMQTSGGNLDALLAGTSGIDNMDDTRTALNQESWSDITGHPFVGMDPSPQSAIPMDAIDLGEFIYLDREVMGIQPPHETQRGD